MAPKIFTNSIDDVVGLGDESKSGYKGKDNIFRILSSPVVSALDSESDDPGSSPGRGKALCTWDVRVKKMRAPLLGLAKSIYYYDNIP